MSQIKIFAGKPSRYGDIICYLPFITYLKKIYPDSYITFLIDKTCATATQFLLNYPGIDRFKISKYTDKVVEEDYDGINYDIVFNLYNQLTRPDYYNHHSVQKENFIMSEVITPNGNFKINPIEYDRLTAEQKYPKLSRYFDIGKRNKTIAIWPFSGYKKSQETDNRSPSLDWWNELLSNPFFKDYKILEFGHPNSESVGCDNGIENLRHLSLFDSIKISMECDISITTDSGVSHILGAYGVKQVCLYSNYQPNHISNLSAMTPMNINNNLISVLGQGNINNISNLEVISKIKELIEN